MKEAGKTFSINSLGFSPLQGKALIDGGTSEAKHDFLMIVAMDRNASWYPGLDIQFLVAK